MLNQKKLGPVEALQENIRELTPSFQVEERKREGWGAPKASVSMMSSPVSLSN